MTEIKKIANSKTITLTGDERTIVLALLKYDLVRNISDNYLQFLRKFIIKIENE